jgi:hypothetical protein
MNIACLGWGSLIWDPRTLPIQRCWFTDGPLLPIEFARQSAGGRITLVITPGARKSRVLWTLMTVIDVAEAITALASREGIKSDDASRLIGHWEAIPSVTTSHDPISSSIASWGSMLGLDSIIWTNLPPKFGHEIRVPSVDEVVTYLRSRPPAARSRAEEYVRRAPQQIDTPYRRRIETELGWSGIEANSAV